MKVYLGLGANLGEPEKTIREALRLLEARALGRVTRVSSFYRTEPVGFSDQPWFVNAAAELETELSAIRFHEGLKQIEADLGRDRGVVRNGPRLIDLDILLFGRETIQQAGLIVPHPRMPERKFVLVPLAEIAPQARPPGLNRTVADLLREVKDPSRVEKVVA